MTNQPKKINIKQIITGKTGSGKTYHTIKKAQELGKFAYIAPCRQLAYEIYIDYANPIDCLSTGEIKLNTKENGNFFGVYESATTDMIQNYESIIIDEAHFITDEHRGANLYNIIKKAKKLKKNIFLVTATINFNITDLKKFELIELESSFNPTFKKVTYEEYIERKNNGIRSISFKKYKDDAMLSADTRPSKRLQMQLDYRNKKITYVSTTNVLAQGINMPAKNILIEYNEHDSQELLSQKIGRLGRLGFGTEDEEYTYCMFCLQEEIETKEIQTKKRKLKNFCNLFFIEEHKIPYILNTNKKNLKRIEEMRFLEEYLTYNNVKYSKDFINLFLNNKELINKYPKITTALKNAKIELKIEAEKIKTIILENMKNKVL